MNGCLRAAVLQIFDDLDVCPPEKVCVFPPRSKSRWWTILYYHYVFSLQVNQV